jgi:holo-[acyl-carrier protein] synthase
MVVGIGVDIEEVGRIREAIERHGQRLIDRVYTAGEVAYVETKANRWERYAARFAAKEAAMKALGTGWAEGVGWRDVEIVNEPGGRPTLVLHGRARERANALGCDRTWVSLSHTRAQAVAQVVLESE